MSDIVPRKTLVKEGGKAIGGIGGGIVLLALSNVAGIPALIIGGIIALLGLGVSGSRDDRKAGLIITAAGILTALGGIPILGGIAGTLMSVAGIGLLAMGGISLFKFIRGYLKRI